MCLQDTLSYCIYRPRSLGHCVSTGGEDRRDLGTVIPILENFIYENNNKVVKHLMDLEIDLICSLRNSDRVWDPRTAAYLW